MNRETLLNDDDKVEVFGSNPIDLIQEMRESLRGSKDNSDTISLEEDSEMENQMNYVDTKQFWLEMERRSRAGSNRSVLNWNKSRKSRKNDLFETVFFDL